MEGKKQGVFVGDCYWEVGSNLNLIFPRYGSCSKEGNTTVRE